MKPTPIEVEEYHRTSKILFIFIKNTDEVVEVPRKEYEKWVKKTMKAK